MFIYGKSRPAGQKPFDTNNFSLCLETVGTKGV